jgi:hypothetical protein
VPRRHGAQVARRIRKKNRARAEAVRRLTDHEARRRRKGAR